MTNGGNTKEDSLIFIYKKCKSEETLVKNCNLHITLSPSELSKDVPKDREEIELKGKEENFFTKSNMTLETRSPFLTR